MNNISLLDPITSHHEPIENKTMTASMKKAANNKATVFFFFDKLKEQLHKSYPNQKIES